uniref:Uncharacterized protein n=1 Tax=Leptospira santarosai serovar Arenal str. MAVJ 401 TaxID=1049976 RepID=M6K4X0_9LEPT|nr:hypothetical protein LEP1GSC063_1863 [Leptospira santarosai serovar Arenal str. MAVJ 401]
MKNIFYRSSQKSILIRYHIFNPTIFVILWNLYKIQRQRL